MSLPTAYGRFGGAYPFTAAQLEQVAAFLGMGVSDLYALAVHGARFTGHGEEAASVPRFRPRVDIWEQPARARRRRSTP